MAGTTSLGELPLSSSQNSNIPVVQTENIQISNPLQQQVSSRETDIDKPISQNENMESYNELIQGLQSASQQGQTSLPDRNIPQQTTSITTDEAIQPNYIPETQTDNYIDNLVSNEEVISYNKNLEENNNNIENIYQDLQQPILIAILYFLFQLPIIQKYLFKIIPSLYKTDGNPNIFGYILNSLLFSALFYFLLKGLKYFSSI